MTILTMIHPQRFTSKPTTSNMNRLYNGFETVEATLEDIAQAWVNGQTIIPAVCENARKKDSFIQSNLFVLDFDNEESKGVRIADEYYITPQEALDMARQNGLEPFVMYTSFSHSEACEKFRMAFAVEEPIRNNERRSQVLSALINVFQKNKRILPDIACKNANRMFYGGRTLLHYKSTFIDIDCLVEAYEVSPTPSSSVDNYNTKVPQVSSPKLVVNKGSQPKELSAMVQAIEARQAIDWSKELSDNALRPYGINRDLPYAVTMVTDDFKRVPLSLLLDVPQEDAFRCILPGHEDNNPSAHIVLHELSGMYTYHCHRCGHKDVFDIVQAFQGTSFKEAKGFIQEAFNVIIETKFNMREKMRIMDAMRYLGSDQFAKDYPILAKELRRYNEWAHLHFYLSQAIEFMGDAPLLQDGRVVFFQAQSVSKAKMLDLKMKGIANMAKIVVRLRELGLLTFLGLEDLPKKDAFQLRQWMEANKYPKHVSYYAVPEYTRSLLGSAQQMIIDNKSNKGITKRGMSRSQTILAYGQEKANEVYTQTKLQDFMSEQEAKCFHRYKQVLAELIDNQGHAHEDEIMNKIRIKGLSKVQKKTYVQRFRPWALNNGYEHVMATSANKATYGIPSTYNSKAKVFILANR